MSIRSRIRSGFFCACSVCGSLNPNLMTSTQRSDLVTFAIAAASSLFFCSKGVFVKSAYAHGVDAITILTLRMAMALPFFAVVAWACSAGGKKIGLMVWAKLAGLGFVGYYLSAIVNFTGLQYVSVGLERIVLFTYPSIVLLLGVVFRKRTWSWKILGALALWQLLKRPLGSLQRERLMPVPVYILGTFSAMWCIQRGLEALVS